MDLSDEERRAKRDRARTDPYRSTGSESVSVAVSFREAGASVPLVGSALIEDDAATAAVRAALQALNRKLS